MSLGLAPIFTFNPKAAGIGVAIDVREKLFHGGGYVSAC